MIRRSPLVLFAAAAGAEIGYGHLVRCGVLADALGVARHMTLRAGHAAVYRALRFGWSVHRGPVVAESLAPDLIVVDDPSPVVREEWVRRAHAAGVPVAVIGDGDVSRTRADVIVDAGFAARRDHRRHRLFGPSMALLAPAVRERRPQASRRDATRVLIALGGGVHVRRLGASVARELVARLPHVHVHIAAGFVDARLPLLPVGSRWVNAPAGLVDEFAAAGVAVVAGGMTMYEACALGTPTVAIPVVPAQRAAIEAAAEAGAVRTTPRKTPRDIARAVGLLIGNSSAAAAQAAVASRLVDGRGAERAAARLSELIDAAFTRGTRHAA